MAAMKISFNISTAPSLVPNTSLNGNASGSTRLVVRSGPISCSRIKASGCVDSENGITRRQSLHGLGAAVGLVLFGSSGTLVEPVHAADLIQRRQRSEFQSNVKDTLFTAIKANPDLISPLLTLALNDAMTYDKGTKSGGPNGSIRLSSEVSRPENKGLSAALNLLMESKKEIDSNSKGGPIAFADLIQCAAQSATKATFLASAIRKCGGNEEKGSLLYTAYGSNGQWGLFDRQFGRTDADEPDPEGRVPVWEKASVKEMKDKFSSVGFGPRQLAVMSAFLGPDQAATEALLVTDPDVAPWVQKYQRSRETVSQTDYEIATDRRRTFTGRHRKSSDRRLTLAGPPSGHHRTSLDHRWTSAGCRRMLSDIAGPPPDVAGPSPDAPDRRQISPDLRWTLIGP